MIDNRASWWRIAFLALGLASPFLVVSLGPELAITSSVTAFLLLVALLILALSITPSSIYYYFAGRSVRVSSHQIVLGLVVILCSPGFFLVTLAVELFSGFSVDLPTSLAFTVPLWVSPPFLALLVGLGLARLEASTA